jgi:Fic family protein
MSSFKPSYLKELTLPPSVGWSLAKLGEGRGLQVGWQKSKPETIAQLRESALIQSVESSNRIEGVEVEKKRLIPLVMGSASPKDRPEEEIVGYRKALTWIHKQHQIIKITPATIKKLHKLAQGGLVGDAGRWKTNDNEIVEFSKTGDRRIRFKCTSAKDTPKAIEQLCLSYKMIQEQTILPELLTVANFILDFLCIHPFRDGNGRISRLLTLLCLYQNDYQIGRYMSLERIIENTKEDYYRALADSSFGWHSSKHDLLPWWSYFLSHLRSAYGELKERVDTQNGDSKTSLIRSLINETSEPFSVLDLMKLQPSLDREIIKKVLSQLKKEKAIKLIGKGRGARWTRL